MNFICKVRWGVVCLLLLSGSGLYGQAMGLEDDEWGTESSDSRFAGLARKSGTLFRRTREDTPDAQLALAAALQEQGRVRAAANQFNALVHRWPDAEEAPAAQLAFARIMLQRGRHERAFREFQYLIEYYVGSFPYKAILAEQAVAAKAVMEQRRGGFFFLPGFQSPERAIPLFQIIIRNGPNWVAIPEIRLLIAKIHEDGRDYADAVAAYEQVIIYHGDDAVAREAIFRKAVCLARIANRHPRDERQTRVALQALFAALREELEPNQMAELQELVRTLHERLEHLHFEQAEFYAYQARNPAAAVLSYQSFLRRFPNSARAALVRERLAALTADTGEEE